MNKDTEIKIRLTKTQKEQWKQICQTKEISLTSLIIDSVENRIFDNERKELLAFIEKQGNIFSKIENNINQYARYANTKKNLNSSELKDFNEKLSSIIELKSEQNKVFSKLYYLIGR